MNKRLSEDAINRFIIRISIDLWIITLIVFLLLLFLSTGCSQANNIPSAEILTPVSNPYISSPTSNSKTQLQTKIVDEDTATKVSGYVISGGDTTPDGLMDAPRVFEYQVETDVGSIINVTYTAFPPSPSGNKSNKNRLDFYAGEILIGDYLQASGTYDKQTNTLIVREEEDYILTYPTKP